MVLSPTAVLSLEFRQLAHDSVLSVSFLQEDWTIGIYMAGPDIFQSGFICLVKYTSCILIIRYVWRKTKESGAITV